MDFTLSEEEKLIQSTAVQFVKKELLTREGDYLRQRELFLPPGDPPRRQLDANVRQTLTEIAQRLGLWTLELPEAGLEPIGYLARVLVYREFGRSILPFGPACVPALLAKTAFAKDLGAGKLSLALAFDQIHKTGTLDGINTRYRPGSAGFSISNSEITIYDPSADLFLMPAREQGTHRIGLFLIQKNSSGISIEDEVDLTNDAAMARLHLRDLEVPESLLLGYEYEAGEILAAEQLRIAARCLGIGMRCLADSIEHARTRETFGRTLAQRQAIQWMLADLSVDLRSCTWLTMEAASRADQSLPFFDAAALAKKRAAAMAFSAADTAIQIHGGYGVCKEFPFEGFYRETRMLRLMCGREAELNRAMGQTFLKVGLKR
jgi:alkylation response protein AidB-like acyl-CoA dehydrogenase